MTSARLLVVIPLLALAACKGDTGAPGSKGDTGPDGSAAPTTGTLTGVVTDGVAHDALAGVAVTASDEGGGELATAITDASGKFSVTVTAGPVELTFAKTDYTSPGTLQTGVGIGETVQLAVTMNEAASGKPSLLLSAVGDDFGYGNTATLTATAADPNGDTLTYAWANTTSPVIPGATVSGNGATGTIQFPTMTQAFATRSDTNYTVSGYALENRFGVVPIIPDTRGQVTAKVTVDDGRGQATSASLTLNAASVTGNLRNVPVGQRIYVNSGHDTNNAWTLTTVPTQSAAAFDNPAIRTPSFVVDKPGAYVVSEGGNSWTITAATFYGMVSADTSYQTTVTPPPGVDSECLICHGNLSYVPDKFTPWAETAHARMFADGINGVNGTSYSGACIGCHTVGYDLGVASGGFDDVAAANGWTFPKLDPSNWTNMLSNAAPVARLANIQCESCHGPQTSGVPLGITAHGMTAVNGVSQPFQSPRISYSAELCATCHGAGSHHIYSDWSTTAALNDSGVRMGHSNRTTAQNTGAGPTGLNSSCGRCHTAQGYTLYAGLLKQGKVALNSVPAATLALVTNANAEPVTCTACHEPHDATNPNQLRFYDDTPMLPSGFAAYGMGKGALCITCHNTRNGAQTGSDALTYLHEDGQTYNSGNPTGYSAPHQAAQGDVFVGHNAYFMGANMPMTSRHAAITDTCVGCHMKLNPETYLSHGSLATAEHQFRITDANQATLCANCHGSTVDGAGIQGQVEAQLNVLANKIGNAVQTKINGLATAGSVKVRAYDPATGLYTSASGSTVLLDLVNNPVTSASIVEVHGQIGYVLNFGTPITLTFTDSSQKSMTSFQVGMGDIKDGPTGLTAIYVLSGNLVRGAWNYFLIEDDASKGLHNPSFVTAVLNNTIAKDLSN